MFFVIPAVFAMFGVIFSILYNYIQKGHDLDRVLFNSELFTKVASSVFILHFTGLTVCILNDTLHYGSIG